MSKALDSQGMYIEIGDGATPEVFTEIEEVTNISVRTGSTSITDVTTLRSVAKEKRAGLRDEGQCTLSLNYNPSLATHETLVSRMENKTLSNFKVHFTDEDQTVYSFSGYITSVPPTAAKEASVESSVTIEISGAVTRTKTVTP